MKRPLFKLANSLLLHRFKMTTMRKKQIIAIVFALVSVYTSYAQSSKVPNAKEKQRTVFTGGAILESNMSGFFHSGVEGGNSIMKAGFSVGGFLNLGITQSFSVQGEILIHYKNSEFKWDTQKGDFSYWGIEIPIYAMYHYAFPKGNRLHIGIGPYTEFGFDARFKHGGIKADLYQKDGNSGLPILQDSNTGFGIKIGYEFISGFQINGSYKASVSNLLDANSSRIKMHPHTISIGVAYRFGK